MGKLRRAIAFSALDKYASQFLQIATLAIMSRLLTPAEVGTYMVASSIFLIADSLRTFGVGVYVVQSPQLRREALRTAFTITVALSLATAAALNLLAAPLAAFYGEPELAHLVSLSTLAFLVVPFATPVVALLQREMAFGDLAAINLGAAITGFSVTVTLGLGGFGAVSYVWGSVAQSVAIAVIAVGRHRDFGIFRFCSTDARKMLAFGALSSTTTVVNMAYDLLPRLAFGRILGFDAVGVYARAVTVCQIPDRMVGAALQPVVLPAMSAHSRAGGSLREAYLRGHAMMSAMQWPALLCLALLADPVVRILLGTQWSAAVPLVRLVALANMALAPAFMTFPVLVASGRIRDTLTASALALPPSVLVVTGAAWLGGLTAVAASLFVVAPVQMLIALHFVRRATGLTWRELAAASRGSALVAAATAAAPAAIVALSPGGPALGWPETALAVVGAGLGWIVALRAVDHPVADEIFGAARAVHAAVAGRRAPAAAHRAE